MTLSRLTSVSRVSSLGSGSLGAGGVNARDGIPTIADWFFSKDKKLTDRDTGLAITFTRASDGTRFDSALVLQTETTDVARFDHLPSDGASLGLRIEAAATNQALQSEDFSTTWSGTGTVVTNVTVAPDGATTADTNEDDSGSVRQSVAQTITGFSNLDIVTGSLYTLKDAVEAATRFPALRIIFLTSGTTTFTDMGFDTQDGTFDYRLAGGSGTAIDGDIEDAGDYWAVWNSLQNDETGNTNINITLFPALGANANKLTESNGALGTITIWGAQLEIGSFPTSYIKTTTAAVTRAKDVASASLILGEHTVVISGRTALGGGTQILWQSDDGSATDRVRIERNASDEMHFISTASGGNDADINLGTVADDTNFNIAIRVATNDMNGVLDGTAGSVDTSVAVPAGMVTVRHGMDSASAVQWMGTIARVRIYDPLTDAQMQTLAP